MRVTKRKLEANRDNGKKSTGPSDVGKPRASQNRRTHGFFAHILRFDTEEEEAEYTKLAAGLKASGKPVGALEELLVDRMATLMWHDRKVLGLLQRQLAGYEKPQLDPQLAKFVEGSCLPEVAIPGLQKPGEGTQASEYSPWEYRELVVKVTKGHYHREGDPLAFDDEKGDDSKQDTTGFYVGARLGHAIDTLLRYHTTFERSFERTLNQLLKLQILRRNSVIDGKG